MVDVGVSAVDMLDVDEVARRTRLSKKTIWRLCWSGEIDSCKVGRRRLIPPEAVTAYLKSKLASQQTPSGTAADAL
jgi:excisionase family DNA binding protein